MNRLWEILGFFATGLLVAFFGTAMLNAWAYDAKLKRAVGEGMITINGTYYRLQPVQ